MAKIFRIYLSTVGEAIGWGAAAGVDVLAFVRRSVSRDGPERRISPGKPGPEGGHPEEEVAEVIVLSPRWRNGR